VVKRSGGRLRLRETDVSGTNEICAVTPFARLASTQFLFPSSHGARFFAGLDSRPERIAPPSCQTACFRKSLSLLLLFLFLLSAFQARVGDRGTVFLRGLSSGVTWEQPGDGLLPVVEADGPPAAGHRRPRQSVQEFVWVTLPAVPTDARSPLQSSRRDRIPMPMPPEVPLIGRFPAGRRSFGEARGFSQRRASVSTPPCTARWP